MKQPHILCEPGELSELAIVVGDPARVERVGALLENPRPVASNREFTSLVGEYQGKKVSVMSTGIGGPSAAIAVEEMIKVGVKVVVRVGSCGSMQPQIKAGDLAIPDSVVSAEGTTQGYVPPEFPAAGSPDVFMALKESAQANEATFHTGTSLTIDSLYARTTPERKEEWSRYGVIAQEMEAAAVLTVARLRNIKAGCVFLVVNRAEGVDIEEGIGKYTEQSVSGQGEFLDKEKTAIKTALDALVRL